TVEDHGLAHVRSGLRKQPALDDVETTRRTRVGGTRSRRHTPEQRDGREGRPCRAGQHRTDRSPKADGEPIYKRMSSAYGAAMERSELQPGVTNTVSYVVRDTDAASSFGLDAADRFPRVFATSRM